LGERVPISASSAPRRATPRDVVADHIGEIYGEKGKKKNPTKKRESLEGEKNRLG